MFFSDRDQAGQMLAGKLAESLDSSLNSSEFLILAIPRGGIVIGHQIALKLGLPLDILVTKKIGAPHHPELAIGAVGSVGKPILDEALVKKTRASQDYLNQMVVKIQKEIINDEAQWRAGRAPLSLKDKKVILTDDGVATGSTIQAALEIIRQENPKRIILAVPVIAKEALGKLEKLADEIIYLEAPELFFAVGQFYQNFDQIKDEEVKKLL
jgi:predicted phosphoribosyltransferase